MTPREQLDRESTIILHGMCRDRHGAAKAISENLNNYAIGRWVSVEERLPEASQYFYVKINGEPEGGCWFDPSIREFDQREPKVSHWLEIDLPDGKGKREIHC